MHSLMSGPRFHDHEANGRQDVTWSDFHALFAQLVPDLGVSGSEVMGCQVPSSATEHKYV